MAGNQYPSAMAYFMRVWVADVLVMKWNGTFDEDELVRRNPEMMASGGRYARKLLNASRRMCSDAKLSWIFDSISRDPNVLLKLN